MTPTVCLRVPRTRDIGITNSPNVWLWDPSARTVPWSANLVWIARPANHVSTLVFCPTKLQPLSTQLFLYWSRYELGWGIGKKGWPFVVTLNPLAVEPCGELHCQNWIKYCSSGPRGLYSDNTCFIINRIDKGEEESGTWICRFCAGAWTLLVLENMVQRINDL